MVSLLALSSALPLQLYTSTSPNYLQKRIEPEIGLYNSFVCVEKRLLEQNLYWCKHLFFQYFKTSLKTRLSIVYVETWEDLDQAPGISKQIEINKAMEDFGAYVQRKLYEIEKDTTQMFTWVIP